VTSARPRPTAAATSYNAISRVTLARWNWLWSIIVKRFLTAKRGRVKITKGQVRTAVGITAGFRFSRFMDDGRSIKICAMNAGLMAASGQEVRL